MNRHLKAALRPALLACLAVGAVTAGPAVAAAPSATTTAATSVTATSATLNGTVSPNGTATSYYFQYGTTTDYGTQTATQPVSGNPSSRDVSADVTGLQPSTTYHFRVVAVNADGTVPGADMTFTTPAPGAATQTLTIAASPHDVTFTRSTTISGQLSGPNNAGVVVTLEQNPAPYTGGFKPTGVKATTSATGAYSMVVTPTTNTRYRVVLDAKPKPAATSPEILVRVRVRVAFRVSDSTPRAGQRVRFSGTVIPAHDGKVARIQRRTSTGAWRTVATATLVAATPVNGVARSKYSKRVRVRRSGTYRVRVAPADGDHIAGTSVRRRLTTH